MGLWSTVKQLIGLKQVEDLGRGTGQLVAGFRRRSLPPSRGSRGVLEAFHEFPILRMAVSRIAWEIADIGWSVTRGGETVDDPPLIDVLENPTDMQAGYIFRGITSAYLDTVGEVIWLVLPSSYNRSGFEFLTIPPTAAQAYQEDGELEWHIRLGDAHLEVPDSNIVHLKYPDLLNPFGRGKGTGEALVDEIEIEDHATTHLASELFNHARPDAQVHISGATDDEVQAVKSKWYEEHGGPQNSGKIMFTGAKDPEGSMEAVELSRSVADTQLLEVRDNEKELVRQTYGIPPEIVGDSKDSNRATIEAAYLLFARGCLRPRLGFLESQLEHKVMPLMPGAGGSVEAEDVVPEDRKFQKGLMKQHPSAFQKNEARQLADHEPLDELEGEFLDSGGGSAAPMGPPGGDDGGDGERTVLPLAREKSAEEDAQQVADEAVPEENEELGVIRAALTEGALAESAEVIADLDADISIDDMEPIVRQTVEWRVEEFWKGKIQETTRDQIEGVILDGLDEGKQPLEIKTDLQEAFDEDISSRRAETIARTEMGSAMNSGKQKTHEKSEVVGYRSWLHSFSGPTARENHEELEQETSESPIPVPQPFETRGHTAMHAQGFGTAEEDANCHCTTIPAFPEDEDKALSREEKEAHWKAFDDRAEERAEQFRQTLAEEYFAPQKERAIETFERIFEGPAQ